MTAQRSTCSAVKPGGANTGIDPVREILYYQLQRLGIVVQDARDHLQFMGQLVIGPLRGKGGVVFHAFLRIFELLKSS